MGKLILDDAAVGAFAGAHEPMEVLTSSGQRLGEFLPQSAASAGSDAAQACAWARAQINDDELDRRSQAPRGHTTAELLAKLNPL
jgi:hypothetical protein